MLAAPSPYVPFCPTTATASTAALDGRMAAKEARSHSKPLCGRQGPCGKLNGMARALMASQAAVLAASTAARTMISIIYRLYAVTYGNVINARLNDYVRSMLSHGP